MVENQTAEETFLIEEAAKYVGVGRRTFERDKTVAYRIEKRKAEDGKMRDMRVYDKSELDRVKALFNEPKHSGALVAPNDANQPAQVVTVSDLQNFAGMIVEGMSEKFSRLQLPAAPEPEKRKTKDFSAFKDKLILSYPQAQALSGLPYGVLKAALDENKISFKKVGRRRYISKESLEEFCRVYFDA